MTLLLALSLLALSAAPAPAPPNCAAAPQSELDQALAAFRASLSRGIDERRAALERLVSLADHGALPALTAEFAVVSVGLREKRDALVRDRYALDHQRRTAERLAAQAERDRSLADVLERQEKRVSDLATRVARLETEVAELREWHALLASGSGRYFELLPASRRKRAEKELWTEVEKGVEAAQRIAAVELLGHAGEEGTALSMQALVSKLAAECARRRTEVQKEMADIRKLEARWQREQEQMDGRHTLAMQQQYERAKRRAAELQRELTLLGHLADAAAEAGGRALARQDGRSLERDLQRLVRAQAGASEGARRRILALIASSRHELALAALRAMLASENEPAARAAAIDALAAAGDQELVQLLLEQLVKDPIWHVRSRAVHALARLRVRAAIPVLIERMAEEEGRLRTDVREALASLTGRDFRTNVELWRRFWRENAEDFVVPDVDDLASSASEEAREALGTTFFGIETESRRVLFVLDLSRSMTFAMLPRRNPNDEDARDPDMPGADEISRLTAAKRALVTAIGGIGDGAVFNLVFYATDVWTWNDRLVTMNAETRSEAMRYVEALDANGGTNIYGALQMALDLAGAKGGDRWSKPDIDTIFFLSDGRATVGVTTDTAEILAFVRERNASAGIVIHTIGLSGAQDAALLQALAEENGGIYVSR